jgi:2-methylisocitrate lyase-like PEP mutase family enzyme
MTQEEKARMFAALHVNTFVLPNAWDAASARIFEEEKFQAIGTTSAGIAFAMGYPDGQRIPRDEMLTVVHRIAKSVGVPVSADVEAGYGDPVVTAQKAWDAGAVGINLEDVAGDEETTHIPLDQQAEVIRRIRAAVPDLVVNARTDIFLMGIGEEKSRLNRTIERFEAYAEAGAHCVFAPGLKDSILISRLTSALKTPLNILAGPGLPNLKEMKDLGVKRVSLGSGPMRACLGLVTRIAQELQNSGTYQAITDGQYPYSEANRLFERKL